jgi:hypothetical protein
MGLGRGWQFAEEAAVEGAQGWLEGLRGRHFEGMMRGNANWRALD